MNNESLGKDINLILLSWPDRGGHSCSILCLVAGLVAGTGPLSPGELVHDGHDACVHLGVAEVAGGVTAPGVVYVQVQGVETAAVLHHGVKHTEALTLLNYKECNETTNISCENTIKL